MASISETGHSKNVSNFDKLIKLLSSVALYVPNEAELTVAALTTVYNDQKN